MGLSHISTLEQTMNENLKRVKRCIVSCEEAKRKYPDYYNIYWRDQHEVLLRVEKELEEKEKHEKRS